MARRLVQQGVQQRRLAKAPDAGDPADVLPSSPTASRNRSIPASSNASQTASAVASEPASRPTSRAASHGGTGRPGHRRGRPRGPERVALAVRIRRELDERLTAAVHQTGQGPQELVERALERELDRLARTQRGAGAGGRKGA